MNKHALIAWIALLLGGLAMVAFKVLGPAWEERQSKALSDARDIKGRIVIGVDNWVGYFPLCSPEMKRRMHDRGYFLECRDDQADTARRLRDLAEGRIGLAVATVDSYLVNGAAQNYPGAIIAVLDESKGGDALVAWKDRLARIEDLQRLGGRKIAFTPDSPSEYLLRTLAVHFDIPPLRQPGPWRVAAKGSSDALKRLLAHEVDAAVLWEPSVSRALREPGIHRLLGTEQTRQLIVDVLIARRELIQAEPELLATLILEYFNTLKEYRDHPDALRAQLQQTTGVQEGDVEALLNGVAWQTLADNVSRWYGLGERTQRREEALIDTLLSTLQILVDSGALKGNPIPGEDPYRLIHSAFLADLYGKRVPAPPAKEGEPRAGDEAFPPLTRQQWESMREIGTLKIRPIVFASGSDQLTLADKMQLDQLAENLRHYPNFRALIRGHTGIRGDPTANQALSQERADSVARYLIVTHGIPETRLRTMGFGSQRPLPRLPDEGERTYAYRLPRVEFALVAESL
jgi:outer membrane protein OmpA-like peptidoglycan-associated protein/ABC-type nitrate/sulfonate/bicarbonate transport system substrate-binding protein